MGGKAYVNGIVVMEAEMLAQIVKDKVEIVQDKAEIV